MGLVMTMKTLKLAVCVLLFGLSSNSSALEVANVNVQESISIDGSDSKLVLNGAGIRKKYFVKVYVGALYLTQKAASVDAVINQAGAKRVLMNFVRNVSADKLTNGWNDGFSANQSDTEMAALQASLDEFNKLFVSVNEGDEILLDYLPGQGTRVTIKGEVKGTVPGEDFYKALLLVWLGEYPASGALKAAMLGGE